MNVTSREMAFAAVAAAEGSSAADLSILRGDEYAGPSLDAGDVHTRWVEEEFMPSWEPGEGAAPAGELA